MKKKIVTIFLVSAFSVLMTACSKSSDLISDITNNSSKERNGENTIKSGDEGNTIHADDSQNKVIPPTVLDYGYVVLDGFDSYYVEYAYGIKNENSVDIEYPTVKITARDKNGAILASEEDVRGYISAGDTIYHASQISCESMPESIEIVGVSPDDYNIISDISERSSADFEIFNVSLQGDSITGEITNKSDLDYEDGFVTTAIFRDVDGNIVTGATDICTDAISAGETTAFEINCMFDPSDYTYDTITVTAYGDD